MKLRLLMALALLVLLATGADAGTWDRGIEDGDTGIFQDFDQVLDWFFGWMPGWDNPLK